MGYGDGDDDDRDEALEQITQRLDTLERENASLKQQVNARPAGQAPSSLTPEEWEAVQEDAKKVANEKAQQVWQETGSREAMQLKYVETLEEMAGRAGGE